jgi:excisionase family DNA binding protein
VNIAASQVVVSSEPDLLTVPQALAALNIGRTCYYELVASGELVPIRIGKRHLLPRSQKDDFIAKRLACAQASRKQAAA